MHLVYRQVELAASKRCANSSAKGPYDKSTSLAAFYWLTPAGALPPYVPGFEAGSTNIHFMYRLASLILALGLFAYAWFRSAPSKF
jgi:hypothetical protein